MAVKLGPFLNVFAGDPGGHRQHGVEAGQLGEAEPAVSAGPLTRARVNMLLQLQSFISRHGFLQTARDELVNKATNTLLLNFAWNEVVGNSLQCRRQMLETKMPFLNFYFLNFL